MKTCDIHYHTGDGLSAERTVKHFLRLKEATSLSKICLLSIPVSVGTSAGAKAYRLENLWVLMIKDMLYPYAFAYLGFYHGKDKADYLTQVKTGVEQGFEGIKILETKPDTQKYYGVRMCDNCFDDAFSYAEENNIPVLMHVADPATSWDIDKVDKWAYDHGRFYGLPGFMTREELYNDSQQILKNHPDLKVTFAHFYFMGGEIQRAEELFERFDNVSFDLTPGKEMYTDFGTDNKRVRDFFIKYADRIYFGTDTNDQDDAENIFNYQCGLNELVNRALDESEKFNWHNTLDCYPLNLPEDVKEKIRYTNFIHLLGETPKKVNYEAVKKEIAVIEQQKDNLSDGDKEILEVVKAYFCTK